MQWNANKLIWTISFFFQIKDPVKAFKSDACNERATCLTEACTVDEPWADMLNYRRQQTETDKRGCQSVWLGLAVFGSGGWEVFDHGLNWAEGTDIWDNLALGRMETGQRADWRGSDSPFCLPTLLIPGARQYEAAYKISKHRGSQTARGRLTLHAALRRDDDPFTPSPSNLDPWGPS